MDNKTLDQQALEWLKERQEKVEANRQLSLAVNAGILGHVSLRLPPDPLDLEEPLRSKVQSLALELGIDVQ